MPAYNISDDQWCLLDLLVSAKRKGVMHLKRAEVLGNEKLPASARVRLVWAALTMPGELIVEEAFGFRVTAEGEQVFNLRFDKKVSGLAETVICLPDHSMPLS